MGQDIGYQIPSWLDNFLIQMKKDAGPSGWERRLFRANYRIVMSALLRFVEVAR